jgi:hypothetical protein
VKRVLFVLAIGCSTRASTPPLSNTTAERAVPDILRISEAGLGPLGATSEATEAGLRAEFPKLTVKTTDLGAESGIVFDVLDGDEKLFYVVPDENEGADANEHRYANTIFAMFATSPRIEVADHAWRVGRPLDNADGLVGCECWGDGEVTSCAVTGHLRVVFEDRCEAARDTGPRAMLGHKVGRIMWVRVVSK